MPGLESCGRCGTSLTLATAAIDVHPPRASDRARTLRRWFPTFRLTEWLRQFGEAIGGGLRTLFGRWEPDRPAGSLIGRMIVPGWPQLYCGQVRGWVFLGVWLVSLLLLLAFVGTWLGSVCLGITIAAHASSVLDVIATDAGEVGQRIARTILSMAAVLLLVYWPAGWVLGNIADPMTIQQVTGPLQQGDVVLVNHWAFGDDGPAPGDVVLFDVPQTRISAPGRVEVLVGPHVDRVLAGPGSEVQWRTGRLFVDGEAVVHEPLADRVPANTAPRTVPDDHWLVFPSTNPFAPTADTEDVWRASLVPRALITGRVYLRTQPFSRFGRIR